MIPFMAALVFAALVVVGLALDAALLAATYREAAFAADVGAEAGAAEIARDGYGQGLVLDRERAEATAAGAALTARPRPGRSVAAAAGPTRVCVTVTDRYEPRILGAVGIGPEVITIKACAEPRQG